MPGLQQPLTEREARFVQEYLIDANASAAALRAGYPAASNGGALMQRPVIQEAIANAQAERAERCEVRADWVLLNLKMIVERSMELVPVTEKGQLVLETDHFGEVRGLVKYDPKAATAALALLAKISGMLVDRVEHSGSVEQGATEGNIIETARRVAELFDRAMKEQNKQSLN